MRTIKCIFITLILLFGTSIYAVTWSESDHLASKSIYKIVPRDKLTFELGRGSHEDQTSNPLLYGAAENELNEIKCIYKSHLGVYSYSNVAGSIKLSVCPTESLTSIMVSKMEDKVNDLVTRYFAKSSPQAMEEAGLMFKKVSLENEDIYYFPVFAIGHGILQIKTAVLFPHDNSNIFVIQYYESRSCKSTRDMDAHRLCKNNIKVLMDILTTFRNDYRNRQ